MGLTDFINAATTVDVVAICDYCPNIGDLLLRWLDLMEVIFVVFLLRRVFYGGITHSSVASLLYSTILTAVQIVITGLF